MGLRAYAVKAQVRMGRPWLSRRVVQILILLLCMTGRNARRFFWNVLHSRVLRPSKRISLVIVSGGFFARAAVGTFQFRDIRCP